MRIGQSVELNGSHGADVNHDDGRERTGRRESERARTIRRMKTSGRIGNANFAHE